MSWLRSGLSQSITGSITSLKGQLEDILTEGTEEIEDPRAEVRASAEKLKEYERQLELVKAECVRWKEEAAEMGVKCQTFEAQLAQRQDEYRRQLAEKQAEIASLKTTPSSVQFADTFQKSALMEDFEELMPQNEFSDYIQLQKEIKRLNQDNEHFMSENRQMLARIKQLENKAESSEADKTGEATAQDMMANSIRDLNEQIGELQRRLEAEKDRGQEAVVAIQQSYKDKARELSEENAALKQQLAQLQAAHADNIDIKISSSKSDDGWQINDIEEVTEQKTASASERSLQVEGLLEQLSKAEEELEKANVLIAKLRKKEANKDKKQKADDAVSVSTQTSTLQEFNVKHEEEVRALSDRVAQLEADKAQAEMLATQRLEEVEAAGLAARNRQEEVNQERMMLMAERDQERRQLADIAAEKDEISMRLAMKTAQVNAMEERVGELLARVDQLVASEAELLVRAEGAEAQVEQQRLAVHTQEDQKRQLEFVLDDKVRQISQLKASVNEHLAHIEAQSKTVSGLEAELQAERESKARKVEDTDDQTQTANTGTETDKVHTASTASETEIVNKVQTATETETEEAPLTEQKLEELAFFKTQYNQIYGYLEQKNVESLGYYNEIQRLNLVLSDQSRQLQEAQSQNEELNAQYETLCKDFQLHQQMVEELNEQTTALNETLSDTKHSVAARVLEESGRQQQQQQQQQQQHHHQQQPDIIAANEASRGIKAEPVETEEEIGKAVRVKEEAREEPLEHRVEKVDMLDRLDRLDRVDRELHEQMVGELEARLGEARRAELEHLQVIEDLEQRLADSVRQYEGLLTEARACGERLAGELATERAERQAKGQAIIEQDQAELMQMSQRLAREMDKNEKLREHLVEMSDSYTAEAVQAEEREKQLRSALMEAERLVAESGLSLESSGRELEERLEKALERAQMLEDERQRLETECKKSEASLAHQLKVTKNLELVLDRLQKDQDNQHSMEAKEWQRTIKEQSAQIFTLQREIKSHKQEVTNLKDALNEIQILDMELKQKDDIIKQLNDRVGTKDAMIELLEKRIGETQQLNNDYIEKAIIKNLVIGYIKVQQQQEKKQVIKLIGTMLDFSSSEFEQVEGASEPSKWFGLYKPSTPQGKAASGSQLVTAEGSLNQSFTDLFIQYVDRESKPKPNFQFDINTSAGHKKTDGSPVKPDIPKSSNATAATVLSNSPSGAFNRNMAALSPSPVTANSLTAQLASPATANSFLEQILK